MKYEIAECVDDEVREFFAATGNPNAPCPDPTELARLACLRQAPIRVVKVRQLGRLTAAAIATVSTGRVSGIHASTYGWFGQDLHDYGRLAAISKDDLARLMGAMKGDARHVGCDLVLFDNLVSDGLLGDSFPGYVATDHRRLLETQGGVTEWRALTSRKSLRRHWNLANRLPNFEWGYLEGLIDRSDLVRLGTLHRERWAFDALPSAFDHSIRVDEYLAYPGNKVLITVSAGRESVCVLFAIRYGHTLLWHTPVVNVKFLDLSPLEVLLVATAKYCEEHEITCLDLGLGDEPYKARFANGARRTGTILIPVTARGTLVRLARWRQLAYRTRRAISVGKTKAATAVHRLAALRDAVHWYEQPGGRAGEAPDSSRPIAILSTYPEFVDFARSHDLAVLRFHYDRFREGATFAVLHSDTVAISFGWIQRADQFMVGEIARQARVPGKTVLYDFFTHPDYRGRGYYTSLLIGIIARHPGASLAIFARPSNASSIVAIERAGFRRVATLRGFPPAKPFTLPVQALGSDGSGVT